jgi:hypothetical protein
MDSHPNHFLDNQFNIGNISKIEKKEDLNLEHDQSLFLVFNNDESPSKEPHINHY